MSLLEFLKTTFYLVKTIQRSVRTLSIVEKISLVWLEAFEKGRSQAEVLRE